MYDQNGNVLTETRYSDTAGTHKVGSSTFSYDDNRLKEIKHQDGSGNVLADFLYSYDAGGRLISENDNGTVTGYNYDATDQLTQAGTAGYAYDANGNGTSGGSTVAANNELSSDGTWTYQYDAEGNVIGKTKIATGETWSYSYDHVNHLTAAVHKDSSGNVLLQAGYSYDVFGNLIAQSVTTGGSTTVTRFTYEDPQSDVPSLWAELNGSGAVQIRYVQGTQPDQVLGWADSSGNTGWYLTDHLGSVRGITNAVGALQQSIAYDAFGNTSSTGFGRFGYAGYALHAELGLYGTPARFYDPAAGRWLGQDPLGLAPDSNAYRYVNNNPTDGTDPSGLAGVPLPIPNAPGLGHSVELLEQMLANSEAALRASEEARLLEELLSRAGQGAAAKSAASTAGRIVGLTVSQWMDIAVVGAYLSARLHERIGAPSVFDSWEFQQSLRHLAPLQSTTVKGLIAYAKHLGVPQENINAVLNTMMLKTPGGPEGGYEEAVQQGLRVQIELREQRLILTVVGKQTGLSDAEIAALKSTDELLKTLQARIKSARGRAVAQPPQAPRGTQDPFTAWAAKTGRAYDRRFRNFWRKFEGQDIGDGWRVDSVNRRLAEGIQPDLVLINDKSKLVRVHDITSQADPAHLAKGKTYTAFFEQKLPGYKVEYTESYWSGLENRIEATSSSGGKYLPGTTKP